MSRRILIFPKGNGAGHLSMYIDVADSATLPYGWSRYAHFNLTVVNQIHSKYSIRKGNFVAAVIHWKLFSLPSWISNRGIIFLFYMGCYMFERTNIMILFVDIK